jgi:hypothetical protein
VHNKNIHGAVLLCLEGKRVKLPLDLTNYTLLHENVWRKNIWIRVFFNSALVQSEVSASSSGCFHPGKRAICKHWRGGRSGRCAELKILDSTRTRTPTPVCVFVFVCFCACLCVCIDLRTRTYIIRTSRQMDIIETRFVKGERKV